MGFLIRKLYKVFIPMEDFWGVIQYKDAILRPSYLHNGIFLLLRWHLYIESGPGFCRSFCRRLFLYFMCKLHAYTYKG